MEKSWKGKKFKKPFFFKCVLISTLIIIIIIIIKLFEEVPLITGNTGQDGSYLAELLLEKSYQVHIIKRRSYLFNKNRIDHLYQDLHKFKTYDSKMIYENMYKPVQVFDGRNILDTQELTAIGFKIKAIDIG